MKYGQCMMTGVIKETGAEVECFGEGVVIRKWNDPEPSMAGHVVVRVLCAIHLEQYDQAVDNGTISAA